MSRLTERKNGEIYLKETGYKPCGDVCNSMGDYDRPCDLCPIDEAFKKLAQYEDLEDLEKQGRLIERKHGRWIHKDNFIGKYLMCSECSHVTGRKSNYCPNCGAKMDEVAE